MSSETPLGKAVKQPLQYAPEILAAVPRAIARSKSGVDSHFFSGIDRWTAYEFVWKSPDGRLHPSILDFEIGARSENIVESKSLKLYLNSCYYASFSSSEEVKVNLTKEIEDCVLGDVKIELISLNQAEQVLAQVSPTGTCIDQAEMTTETELAFEADTRVHECLYSHSFRSLCPVTSQPDWATILIEYRGAKLSKSALLSYLRGYAEHDGFHEYCVEMIYSDLVALPAIEDAAVCAKFLRRGGIDICPFRTSTPDFTEPKGRLIRQ